jgi:hypothetical protein
VRPGWFDYNGPDEHQLVLLQGDTRQAGDSSDGVIARRQIAEVLVSSLGSDHALRKTFELIATTFITGVSSGFGRQLTISSSGAAPASSEPSAIPARLPNVRSPGSDAST